jgi:hypothetical protein
LNIQGKLVVEPEDDHVIQIVTPFVLVQGELHLNSSTKTGINGMPNIRITIENGTARSNHQDGVSFHPAPGNQHACDPHDGCHVGDKPIVVAGGKLVLQGLPRLDMPTWVPLHDVATTTEGWTLPYYAYQSYKAPPTPTMEVVEEGGVEVEQSLNCPLNGIYVSHDFSDPSSSLVANDGSAISSDAVSTMFTGSLGTRWERTRDSLRIYQRTSTLHGAAIDMKDIRGCLVFNRAYLLTMRVRLTRHNNDSLSVPELTSCATSGTHCLSLQADTLMEDGLHWTPTKWTEQQSHQSVQNGGVIFTVAAEVHFDTMELDAQNVHHQLVVHGAPPGIDLDLLEFTLRLPPESAHADPNHVCGNWVPANGNIDQVGWHPFPFATNNPYTHVVVARDDDKEKEKGNSRHYLQVTGRSFSINRVDPDSDWGDAGLSWNIPCGCVKQGSKYRYVCQATLLFCTVDARTFNLYQYSCN